jgi:quercetin dioxygenase-like cupin family protein
VGVSASLISQIETGKCQPSVGTLYAITTALGISVEDVFQPPAGAADVPAGTAAPPRAPGAPPAGAAPLAAVHFPAAAATALAAIRGPGVVGRPNEREVLRLDSGVTWERLGHVPGVPADFLLVTYAPGGSSSASGQFMWHAGTEFGYLMEGELILTLGAEEHRLTAGQSVCFPSSTPHRYRNDAARPAVGVWFVAGQDSVFSIR